MATLSQAQDQLAQWEAASLAVSKGSSYTINGRTLTREQSGDIAKMITRWSRTVKELTAKASGSRLPGAALPTFARR